MDQGGADPRTIVAAYARCIGLLNELMSNTPLFNEDAQKITSIVCSLSDGVCCVLTRFLHDSATATYNDFAP